MDADHDARTRAVIAAVQRDGTCWLGGSTWRGQAPGATSMASKRTASVLHWGWRASSICAARTRRACWRGEMAAAEAITMTKMALVPQTAASTEPYLNQVATWSICCRQYEVRRHRPQ